VLGATLAAAWVVSAGGLAWNARFSAREAAAGQSWELARNQALRATRAAPWHPDGWLLLAHATIERGASQAALREALAYVERAVLRSPVRPSARQLRSTLRLALGDGPGAYADAAEAVRLHPYRAEYRAARDRLRQRLRPGPPP
jgi:hypothetical protein